MGGVGLITSLWTFIHSFIHSFVRSFIHSAEQAACTAEERVHNRVNLCACTGEENSACTAEAPPRLGDLGHYKTQTDTNFLRVEAYCCKSEGSFGSVLCDAFVLLIVCFWLRVCGLVACLWLGVCGWVFVVLCLSLRFVDCVLCVCVCGCVCGCVCVLCGRLLLRSVRDCPLQSGACSGVPTVIRPLLLRSGRRTRRCCDTSLKNLTALT